MERGLTSKAQSMPADDSNTSKTIFRKAFLKKKYLPLEVTEGILSPASDYGNWKYQTNSFFPSSLKKTVKGQVSLHHPLARKYLCWGNQYVWTG